MASKRRRRIDTPVSAADPTPERLAKGAVEYGDDGRGRRITRALAPLDLLLRRDRIKREQYEAGVKYRHHWYAGGQAGNLGSASLDRVLGGGCGDGEIAQHHRTELYRARQALRAIEVATLDAAVCLEWTFKEIGLWLGADDHPIAIAKWKIAEALEALRTHWRI